LKKKPKVEAPERGPPRWKGENWTKKGPEKRIQTPADRKKKKGLEQAYEKGGPAAGGGQKAKKRWPEGADSAD